MEQLTFATQWIGLHLNELGLIVAVLAFLLSIVVLAFSAYRYVTVRKDELNNERYGKYHKLIRDISTGSDGAGLLKLASQRAYIYELRHFPEYKVLTKRLLASLMDEWGGEEDRKNAILKDEIKETVSALR
ncbi:hypothetical protein J2Y86_005630 [Pseudomonas migulae]|uniref:hypothetical protein n=1 Tax=Pseudomonas migulae TaxID=78543 RepID=UPI00209F18D4|nr:hypothetical protein [Pseudomonas migulae]MCP1500923.1 hypothetical protein [Pseudomonas migulae]